MRKVDPERSIRKNCGTGNVRPLGPHGAHYQGCEAGLCVRGFRLGLGWRPLIDRSRGIMKRLGGHKIKGEALPRVQVMRD
jgi:hypothetical protein